MLYGEFRETSSREVRLNYTGAVLRVVVEFCFTDDGNASHHFDGLMPESFVRSLVRVAAAAHYLNIPRLETDVFQTLTAKIADLPSLACAVYDESIQLGNPVETLSGMALEKIRARPRSSLLPVRENVGGVRSLNESLLETIVFDKQSMASEFVKFQCLQKWEEGGENGGSTGTVRGTEGDSKEILVEGTEEKEPEVSEQLSTTITDLAKRLDLSRIPASELISVVAQSHLVTRDDLYQAYQSQALSAQRTKNKIVVEGAGTPEVNGTYTQGGVHEGIPMYHMEGIWDDREVVFSVFVCTFPNGEKSWFITIVPQGKVPGKNTDVDFYKCSVSTSDACGMIPSKGWRQISNGQAPSPTCLFVTGCLDDKASE